MTVPVAYLGDAALSTIDVDCFGQSYIQDLTVAVRGYNWRFLYDPAKRSQRRAQLALFLNGAVRWYMCWYRYPAARRIFVLTESPIEPYFDQVPAFEAAARLILTHDEDLLGRSRHYHRLDYGTSWINGGTPIQACRKEGLVSWFGSIQHPQSHGYAFRREVVEHLQRRGGVDCYGYGLHAVEDKREGLERYAFSVAMENTRQNWYFTEKIVDCFMCETVPIYWGCPKIDEVFDRRGMLSFDTLEQLDAILDRLTFDLYRDMRPYVLRNQAIVLERRLADYAGYYARIADLIAEEIPERARLSRCRCTKAAAALRFVSCGCRRPTDP